MSESGTTGSSGRCEGGSAVAGGELLELAGCGVDVVAGVSPSKVASLGNFGADGSSERDALDGRDSAGSAGSLEVGLLSARVSSSCVSGSLNVTFLCGDRDLDRVDVS